VTKKGKDFASRYLMESSGLYYLISSIDTVKLKREGIKYYFDEKEKRSTATKIEVSL